MKACKICGNNPDIITEQGCVTGTWYSFCACHICKVRSMPASKATKEEAEQLAIESWDKQN